MSGPYWQKDLFDRNKPMTDEELDALIPSAGYEVSKATNIRLIFIFLLQFSKN
jgi:hypothetical protein